jgi:hypothetical protein
MRSSGSRGIIVAVGLGALVLTAYPANAKRSAKEAEPVAAQRDLGALSRDDVNRLASRLDLPLFWLADPDADGVVDPGEVVGLLFYTTQGQWVAAGAFTPAFLDAYDRMVALAAETDSHAALEDPERARRRLVDRELDQGYPTLVYNDLTGLSAQERLFLEHMLAVGALIDELYEVQRGSAALASQLPADSPASASLFRRNHGVGCIQPATEGDPLCGAIPGSPAQPVDPYPPSLQADQDFCEALAEHVDAEALLAPFTVVRDGDTGLTVQPYTEAYAEPMQALARELRAASDAMEPLEGEAALRTYLRAAADSFESNDWEPADEAWSRMNAENSAWYVRVAPDETYWEPCARKAGFHLTLARINTDSLRWQQQLGTVQQEMEDTMAARVGAPYVAREVTFHLPDFIDIVTNHGDDRDAWGATLGQSLPNWGPVANEGRGRTVAMTNLYTDPDSLRVFRDQAEALLDAAAMAQSTDDQEPGLLGTILHEAAHNLGPAHEYEVDGKTDDEVFGGPVATTMEELKAQTASLWYVDFLLQRDLITPEFARQSYAAAIRWCFNHISRGMYTDSGRPKPYAHVSAIHVGMLMDGGVLRWDPEATAANGRDLGAFTLDFEVMPAAVDDMMRQVGVIKTTGDKAAAEALVARHVDGELVPQAIIAERVRRHPKATFVYALDH